MDNNRPGGLGFFAASQMEDAGRFRHPVGGGEKELPLRGALDNQQATQANVVDDDPVRQVLRDRLEADSTFELFGTLDVNASCDRLAR